jgi:hypothetical protein
MLNIMRKIKSMGPIVLILISLGGQVAIPVNVFACGSSTGSPKDQVLNGVNQTGTDCSGKGVTNILSAAVTILSIIIGIAAVIMILVSGYRYITSGGDTNKVSAAKSTLIYALIGVAIAALAQLLVHFVLYQSSKA